MLDITILKNMHKEESNAKKLIPYIQNCDIFSPEVAACSEERATAFEKEWECWLSLSRSKFNTNYNLGVDSSPTSKFSIKLRDIAHFNKKPLWILERFDERQAHLIRNGETIFYNKPYSGFYLKGLVSGEIKNTHEIRQALEAYFEVVEQRDKHIAKQLDVAENRIRNRYPQLKEKDPIKITMSIGYGHLPERHTQIPLKVVDLVDEDLIPRVKLMWDLYQSGRWRNLRDSDAIEYASFILKEGRFFES